MTGTWDRVCATAHRDIPANATAWLRYELDRGCAWLAEHSTRVAVTGMARGGDLMWADSAHRAGLEVWAFVPFLEQTARWNKPDIAEWWRILELATVRHVVGEIPDGVPAARRSAAVNQLMFARNRAMLDATQACLAVWDGRMSGGTHGALCDAAKRRRPGVHLNPADHTITFNLPDLASLRTPTGAPR